MRDSACVKSECSGKTVRFEHSLLANMGDVYQTRILHFGRVLSSHDEARGGVTHYIKVASRENGFIF